MITRARGVRLLTNSSSQRRVQSLTVIRLVNDANAKTENSLIPDEVGPAFDSTHPPGLDEETPVPPLFEDFSNRMLGEFRLLRLLGRGGMAEVYLADQTSLSRQVAIKILRPELKTNSVFLKRFEREARAAASLSHPNIVQVFLVGEEEGLHFIAQEYVKGLNLREYIRRKGPPSAQLSLHFLKQMLLALERAGGAGIVHRDIKPENILITHKGAVKIADFGLAQLTQPDVEQSHLELTQVGTTMGTPLYMSPEQVHGQKLDQRSDLYSLGVTCFHMLAGEPPFRGETAMSVAIQHLNQKPPRLRERRPDLPPAMCQIVHKLMAKDVEKRYSDAAAALKDVKHVQAALKAEIDPKSLHLSGFDLDVDELEAGWVERISRWSRGRKIATYGMACVILAGASASLGWWAKPVDPFSQPAPTQPRITNLPTAELQYNLASQNFADDEDAWKAVIHHRENNKLYRYRAQEQLGLLYLQKQWLDEARDIFVDMGKLEGGELEAEYRAKSLAGLAVIASLEGNEERARELLNQYDAQKEGNAVGLLREYIDKARERLSAGDEAGLME
jgi:eukaryotic-like serine/threonine-protein kinase